eukprot:3953008-Pleurochrysis_carterae.AAC.1
MAHVTIQGDVWRIPVRLLRHGRSLARARGPSMRVRLDLQRRLALRMPAWPPPPPPPPPPIKSGAPR